MAKTRGTGLQAVDAARGRLGRAKLADQRLRPKLPNQDPSDRNDTGAGSFSANGPDRYLGGGGGGIQRPVQYRLHPALPHRFSCLGARRYVIIDSYPKYLTLYQFANATVSESPEWDKVRDSNPWSNRVRPAMRHDVGSPGVYRRVFPK